MRYYYYNFRQPTKTDELAGLIGHEAIRLVKKQFFSLDKQALDRLLKAYGEQFGENAMNYARKAIPKWRSGETKTSAQTLERLCALVPVILSTGYRYTIARAIFEHINANRTKKSKVIEINVESPAQDLQCLQNEIATFYEPYQMTSLPENISNAFAWLTNSDMAAARALIAQIENESAVTTQQLARQEIQVIHRLIRSGDCSLHQTIEFPNGMITVRTYRPKKHLFELIFGGWGNGG